MVVNGLGKYIGGGTEGERRSRETPRKLSFGGSTEREGFLNLTSPGPADGQGFKNRADEAKLKNDCRNHASVHEAMGKDLIEVLMPIIEFRDEILRIEQADA